MRSARPAAAARGCIGRARWTTYADDEWSAGFQDELACGEIVGPAGNWRCDGLTFGLMLMGPETTYPPHAHALHEAYRVLSGEARWIIGRPDRTRLVRAGEVAYTAPHTVHGLRTGAMPVLCAYLWWESPTGGTYRRRPDPWIGPDRVTEPMA